MYLKVKDFENGKPILYGQNQSRTPFGVNLRDQDVQFDAKGHRTVPEGSFVVEIGGETRFLPRAKTTTLISTSSTQVTVTGPSQSFKDGDTVYYQAGYAKVAIDGTIAANDTFTLEINGLAYTYTAAGTSIPNLVTLMASGGPVNIGFGGVVTNHTIQGVKATAQGSTLLLQGIDAYSLRVSCSSGNARMTVLTTEPGFLGDCIIPIGTIQSIALDAATGNRTLRFFGNASQDVPVGARIGVPVTKFLGIAPISMDFTDEPLRHYAPICEADGVYENNLPYCDLQLKREFSDLRINKKFYR